MIDLYRNRAFVSFQGRCPMNCKHCYTYELNYKEQEDIFKDIDGDNIRSCDIIYVSQKYENFYDEKKGMIFCEELYKKYKKDMLIITRSCLSNEIMQQMVKLNNNMLHDGHKLYLAISICANRSYSITEDAKICPTPQKRLHNLQRAHNYHIKTLLLFRPIFPDTIIPVNECIELLEQSIDFIDAVVSSGLIVTDSILDRLGLKNVNFRYLEKGDSSYLADLPKDDVRYLDVEKELSSIQKACESRKIPFFRHSIPALNYLSAT